MMDSHTGNLYEIRSHDWDEPVDTWKLLVILPDSLKFK